MAIRSIIESDMSGEAGAHTLTFGLEGQWYEIDLTDAEADDLRKALQPYLDVSRQSTSRAAGHTPEVPAMTPDEREDVREWARNNNYEVAPYGRINKTVMRAYVKAHPERRIALPW
ncbi:MAG: Lsr2 family protein [Cutibacterium avidum]|nr:Lsr2 family protein [Cutibacterium avidum]